ncbi:hypothetical protein TrRE_jg11340 [Triparma retinervis]|uniref:PCI domain-containing protein n=1 Tax=Triparma retinervis TaxID=2557542 RepID=A0A9W7DQN1_9STRA|nr:hypothetical protein TrRE_jg11340 [Triparma retinervis]
MAASKDDVKKADKAPPSPAKKAPPPPPPLPTIDHAAHRLASLLALPSASDLSASKSKPSPADQGPQSLPSGAGRTVRRWLSSSIVNKCRSVSYAKLIAASKRLLPANSEVAKVIEEGRVGGGMDVEEEADDLTSCPGGLPHRLAVPALEAWMASLAINSILSVDAAAAFVLSANLLGAVGKSAATSSSTYTPPALSPLIARLYRFRALAAEKSGSVAAMQPELVHALRLSTLSRAEEVQATLLNLMLRYYLASKNIDAASKLAANTTFPPGASNNQLCRNLLYSGRIGALRLEYTSAFSKLTLCLRKAPTNAGLAFRVVATKLLSVVQCLSGEIPPRDTFFQPGMTSHLRPYLELVTCVRRGDLTAFAEVVDKHRETISLADIAQRLGLGSPASAEYIVAKSIRDGVIDGIINHSGQYLECKDGQEIYSTIEPSVAFNRRIQWCLETHNTAVKGLRYPEDAYGESKKKKKKGEEDEKTDEEIAQEIEEELAEEEDEF